MTNWMSAKHETTFHTRPTRQHFLGRCQARVERAEAVRTFFAHLFALVDARVIADGVFARKTNGGVLLA